MRMAKSTANAVQTVHEATSRKLLASLGNSGSSTGTRRRQGMPCRAAATAPLSRRGTYVLRHWYDVLLVAIPLLMRLLRLLGSLRVLNRTAAGSLAGGATAYVIGLAVVAVGLGSVAMLDVERGGRPEGEHHDVRGRAVAGARAPLHAS